MRAYPDMTVRIEGFSDNSGSPVANLKLSSRTSSAPRGSVAANESPPGLIPGGLFGRRQNERDCPRPQSDLYLERPVCLMKVTRS